MGAEVAGASGAGLAERVADQAARPVEFYAEFLSHMKGEFKLAFDAVMREERRRGGRDICTYVPIMPGGGPRTDATAEEQIAALTFEDMPDVYVGFQYKERLCPSFRRKFLGRGLFDERPRAGLNADFAACGLDDAVPEVHVFAACPFVLVIDERNLGPLPEPRSWADLLDPMYAGKVCFNGTKYGCDLNVLLYIARRYGVDALADLRRNVVSETHASRMGRYLGTGQNGGAGVCVMSSFFAHACTRGRPRSHMVWPADGAAFQPLFIMGKRGSMERCRAAWDFVLGEEWGQRLADNCFPSTHPAVENRLEGPLDWFGWDFICRDDIDAVVERIDALFGDVPNFGKGRRTRR